MGRPKGVKNRKYTYEFKLQVMEDYFDNAIEFNNLYKGLKKSCRNVRWKDSVIKYEANALTNTLLLRNSLKDGTYKIREYQRFTIYEPKKRDIVATRIPNIAALSLFLILTIIHAVMEQSTTSIAMETTVRMTEFRIEVVKFIFPIALS